MKTFQTENIRNIALIGSAGTGKTSLAEAMVFEGGVISRKGDIMSKNTLSDYKNIELEKGSSVYSSLLYTYKGDNKINILDTPGAKSFVGNVVSSLMVADTAILLINSQNGIESGTERVVEQAEKLNKPVIIAVNHLDQEQSNFIKATEQIKASFGSKAVLVQYPVNAGPSFDSVIDVLTMKMYKWTDNGEKRNVLDIPTQEMDKAKELHNTLVEAAAENDDNLMEIFFDKGTLTEDEMRTGIKEGIENRGMFPIFCTGADRNIGVRRLCEFISNVVYPPSQYKSIETTQGTVVKCDSSELLSLFVFKTTTELHLGEVVFFKVMSGVLHEHEDLINQNNKEKERFTQIFVVNGKNREKVSELHAGDIGATIKLKATKAGHTLSLPKSNEFTFIPMPFPSSKYSTAISPINEADDEKLGEALHQIHNGDPTLILEYSKELKQLILHAQSEYHINTVKWLLANEYKIKTELVMPKIPYRETITKSAKAHFKHKKQSGGAGQFGEVHLVIEPHSDDRPEPSKYKLNGKELTVNVRNKKEYELKWGGKLVFYNCIVGGVIEASYMPAIVKGLMEKMEFGPLTGSYARDIRVCVYDGKMHQVDSNEISFKIAGAKAFSTAFKEASPKLLEPIYDIQVKIPSQYMGDAMSDLQTRRALIQGMDSKKGFEYINAKVPLAEIGNYSTALSSITHGRGSFEIEFSDYSPVPSDLQNELIKAHELANQDEE